MKNGDEHDAFRSKRLHNWHTGERSRIKRNYRRRERRLAYEDLVHTCGDCGRQLQIVRPGKYQCVVTHEEKHGTQS